MASNHLKNGMKDLQSYFPPNNNWSKKQMYNMISNLKKNDVRSGMGFGTSRDIPGQKSDISRENPENFSKIPKNSRIFFLYGMSFSHGKNF